MKTYNKRIFIPPLNPSICRYLSPDVTHLNLGKHLAPIEGASYLLFSYVGLPF